MRVEPCVCGGLIVAPPADEAAVFGAVYRHNATDLHLAWRAGGRA